MKVPSAVFHRKENKTGSQEKDAGHSGVSQGQETLEIAKQASTKCLQWLPLISRSQVTKLKEFANTIKSQSLIG